MRYIILVCVVIVILTLLILPKCKLKSQKIDKKEQKKPDFETCNGAEVINGMPMLIRSTKDTSVIFELIYCTDTSDICIGTNDINANSNEKPQINIRLEPYYISKYEITYRQYKQFLDSNTSKSVPYSVEDWAQVYSWSKKTRSFSDGRQDLPVTLVSWQDAYDYCEWLGARIPTEFEWENAGRGKNCFIYSWGNVWQPTACNNIFFVSGSNFTTAKDRLKYFETEFVYRDATERNSNTIKKIGSYENDKSEYQVYDLCGNVAEWCADWYDPSRYKDIKETGLITYQKEIDSREVAKKVVKQDQFDVINRKVIRGGSWMYCQEECKLTFRRHERPTFIDGSVGFRPALSASILKTK